MAKKISDKVQGDACVIPRMLLTELLHALLMRGITSAPLWKTHKVKNPPAA